MDRPSGQKGPKSTDPNQIKTETKNRVRHKKKRARKTSLNWNTGVNIDDTRKILGRTEKTSK